MALFSTKSSRKSQRPLVCIGTQPNQLSELSSFKYVPGKSAARLARWLSEPPSGLCHDHGSARHGGLEFFYFIYYGYPPRGLVKIKLRLNTLRRSECVLSVNLAGRSRCNSRTGCRCHGRVRMSTPVAPSPLPMGEGGAEAFWIALPNDRQAGRTAFIRCHTRNVHVIT